MLVFPKNAGQNASTIEKGLFVFRLTGCFHTAIFADTI